MKLIKPVLELHSASIVALAIMKDFAIAFQIGLGLLVNMVTLINLLIIIIIIFNIIMIIIRDKVSEDSEE